MYFLNDRIFEKKFENLHGKFFGYTNIINYNHLNGYKNEFL